MPAKRFGDLLEVLDKKKPVIIQAHDYPDHDAVASGFSLLRLLRSLGFSCVFCYSGEMQGFSVTGIMKELDIPLVAVSSLAIRGDEQIILVDGVAGNRNVTSIPKAPLVGIIDHHQPPAKIPECGFVDIRPDYGSCATIIYQYYLETLTEIPRDAATALLTGLMMDTAQMTRGVGPADLAAFSGLFFKGDWEEAAYILRNSFSLQDIPALRYAFRHYYRQDSVCFVGLTKAVRPELLGLIADYFLRMQEIHFVVAAEMGADPCRLSVRSEDPRLPADLIIKRVLADLGGGGGGHPHMSGGTFPAARNPSAARLRKKFFSVIGDFLSASSGAGQEGP
jgi:nanoRNase/pAp phosphatase (c-di-AMP/oligoRNAs hydrolase)